MPCIVPGTISPGKLFIQYVDTLTGYKHRVSWRLYAGVDITILPILRAEAILLKTALVACVISNLTFTEWGILSPSGSVLYAEGFTPVVAGTHPLLMSYAFKSPTVRIEGTAHPPFPGACFGRTNFVVFHQGALKYIVGQKSFDLGTDVGFAALVAAVNASTILPADLFGQPAIMNLLAPVQFNAHAQRVEGT